MAAFHPGESPVHTCDTPRAAASTFFSGHYVTVMFDNAHPVRIYASSRADAERVLADPIQSSGSAKK